MVSMATPWSSRTLIGRQVAAGLGLHGPQVGHEDPPGPPPGDGPGQVRHHRRGQEAGVERPGAEHHLVGHRHRLHRLHRGRRPDRPVACGGPGACGRPAAYVRPGAGGRPVRACAVEPETLDGLIAGRHLDLAHHLSTVDRGHQVHRPGGGGQHPTLHLQEQGDVLEGGGEVAADLGQGGDDQVAEGVPAELPVGEAVLEGLRPHRVGVGQRAQAAAEVARRRDAGDLPQPPARPAVVGHRHHRGHLSGVPPRRSQRGGQAVATTEGRHPGTSGDHRATSRW
jgi:hypothetical protein